VRAVGWWSKRPTWVAWAPVVCLVVWFVVIWAGAAWWGW